MAAAPDWASTPPRERSEILRRTFEAVQRRKDDLALLMTLEMGKPLAESQAEVSYGAEFLRWFAEEAVRITGRYGINPEATGRMIVSQHPVGPCLLITPWNFPLAMATRKVAPALAAGCTVVLKPAELTPLTTLLFATLLAEAGLAARSGQRDHHLLLRQGHRPDHRRPAAAQAQLHGVDRGRPETAQAGRRRHPADLDGAGRQRPVPGLRRRRPRCRGRGGHAGQVPQRRSGLYSGQPVPGPPGRRGGVCRPGDPQGQEPQGGPGHRAAGSGSGR